MKLGIFEILAAADKEPVRDDKIKVLRENVCQPLIDVLIGAYDDRVKWLLPPGNVPFKPAASSGAESMLHSQTRTFYLYVEGGEGTTTSHNFAGRFCSSNYSNQSTREMPSS